MVLAINYIFNGDVEKMIFYSTEQISLLDGERRALERDIPLSRLYVVPKSPYLFIVDKEGDLINTRFTAEDLEKKLGISEIDVELPYSYTFDFSEALHKLREGKAIQREGWNGKNQFVYLVTANRYEPYTEIGKAIADEDNKVEYNPYFAIKTVDGKVSTWVPSVMDCLANDWKICKIGEK